ncbi:aromatic ring-hydroxylating dioxygenase subunit alpha [Tsuneonella sp. CC-YZS046]|uniref:aromatic ring-hydroxylating dioxygenase subunit alpha n=1 Tax=Tsuneonella sp. CC-YZS046 TaxID=3042152 RepID=UPI002D79A15D|nr:aromatic ring-hydroxylating dioxygenase subunit alpha [Tsuneonella sp. CC-YZS046]WRO66210.1 aromatic ring-hydroxylating dioxygenase subunit alpha [Tsuneonella sp. CC-YZS046]
MSFLRDAWYVAAWSEEVGDKASYQKIIGEHVVLFRDESGEIIALGDTCPHRFAPLHMGKVVGSHIQCPYHGLRFDREGRCAHNPFDPSVKPSAAKVPAYPTAERDRIVWIWMGDADKADENQIPSYDWIGDTEGYSFTAFSQMTQAIDYELVLDNLMDLSHGQFLHPTTLGNEAFAAGTTETTATERQVQFNRWNPGGTAPKLFVVSGVAKEGDLVDFWNDVRWDAPGSYYLQVGITPVGQSRENGRYMHSAHLLTPIDNQQLVYRYVLARNFAMDNQEITKGIEDLVRYAFTQEDEPVLRAVQERMAGRDFWDLRPVVLKTDKAAVLVRRTLERLINEECKAPEYM